MGLNLTGDADTHNPDPGVFQLMGVLDAALEQCTDGKGNQRHGHNAKLFDQPWVTLAKSHGIGFLTGQAAKKLNEAASLRDTEGYTREQYERELLGAIVYTAFAILFDRGSHE